MEAASMSSRIAPAPVDIKKLVNKIFAQKGQPEVKNFPKEFSDGSNLNPLILYHNSSLPGPVQYFV
jgi:hypothetical protein